MKRKNRKYHKAIKDEVLFYFDILSDNSLDNIASIMDIDRDKVRKILNERYKNTKHGLSTVFAI